MVASATGSLPSSLLFEGVFCKQFPKLMMGTTVLVPGMVWYYKNIAGISAIKTCSRHQSYVEIERVCLDDAEERQQEN